MTKSALSLTGSSQPLKGMLLMVIATLLFASHDVLSKYLSGIYPVMLVI